MEKTIAWAGVVLACSVAGGPDLHAQEPERGASVAAVGSAAPRFELPDLDGEKVELAALRGRIVVLEWIDPGCPFSAKHHAKHGTVPALTDKFREHGVAWLTIVSGRAAKAEQVRAALTAPWRIDHPVLLDPAGEVAARYGVRRTPHVIVLDRAGVVRYTGAIDDDTSPWSVGPNSYLDMALGALVRGRPVQVEETCAYGTLIRPCPR